MTMAIRGTYNVLPECETCQGYANHLAGMQGRYPEVCPGRPRCADRTEKDQFNDGAEDPTADMSCHGCDESDCTIEDGTMHPDICDR